MSSLLVADIVAGVELYDYNTTFHVMLEPRTLQQLAVQTIFNYKDELPWKRLPKIIMARIGITENE